MKNLITLFTLSVALLTPCSQHASADEGTFHIYDWEVFDQNSHGADQLYAVTAPYGGVGYSWGSQQMVDAGDGIWLQLGGAYVPHLGTFFGGWYVKTLVEIDRTVVNDQMEIIKLRDHAHTGIEYTIVRYFHGDIDRPYRYTLYVGNDQGMQLVADGSWYAELRYSSSISYTNAIQISTESV